MTTLGQALSDTLDALTSLLVKTQDPVQYHELKTQHDDLLDIMAQLVEKTVDSANKEYQIAIGQLQGATASIKAALANIQATAQAIDAIAKAAQAAANVAKMAAGA